MSIVDIFKLLNEIANLLPAIANLFNVLVWPAVILFILIWFHRELRDFMAGLVEVSFKGGGIEASLKRKQTEVAVALVAAEVSRSDGDMSRESTAQEAKIAVDVVSKTVTPLAIRRASRSTVLWVDDRPDNNVYERQALAVLGVNFVLATSTEEALKKMDKQRFDVIISDLGRPPDPRAGYTLLDQLRASGDQTPFIIYAGSRDPKHVAESRHHGAIGCTNNANELFEMVLSALGRAV